MNENQINRNAVSVYGQEGLEDFPVLKAFQQYIDAEQNKARKRLVVLCAFFGFLMTAMIIVFLFILKDVSSNNKAQNERGVFLGTTWRPLPRMTVKAYADYAYRTTAADKR